MAEQYSIEGNNNCLYKCSLICIGALYKFLFRIQEDGFPFHKCDWILEKRSKSHIRSSEINRFKELKLA